MNERIENICYLPKRIPFVSELYPIIILEYMYLIYFIEEIFYYSTSLVYKKKEGGRVKGVSC